ELHMFAALLRKLSRRSRNGSRSRRLEVEALEGRWVPSGLGALVGSAPGVEPPPSPPGASPVRELEPLAGGAIITISVPSGAVDPSGDVTPLAGATVDPNTEGPPPTVGGNNGLLGGATVDPNGDGPPPGTGTGNGLLGGATVDPNADGPPSGAGG